MTKTGNITKGRIIDIIAKEDSESAKYYNLVVIYKNADGKEITFTSRKRVNEGSYKHTYDKYVDTTADVIYILNDESNNEIYDKEMLFYEPLYMVGIFTILLIIFIIKVIFF